LSSNVSTEYPKNIPVLVNQIGSLICGNSVAGKTPILLSQLHQNKQLMNLILQEQVLIG